MPAVKCFYLVVCLRSSPFSSPVLLIYPTKFYAPSIVLSGDIVLVSSTFVDGVQTTEKTFNKPGEAITSFSIKGDYQTGFMVDVFSTANVKRLRKGTFYKGDLHSGIVQLFFDNGALNAEYPLNKGRLNGEAKDYNEDGKLKSINNWKDDALDGTCTDYYSNGQIKLTYCMKKGVLHGWSKEFNDDGILRLEGNYVNGEQDGIW